MTLLARPVTASVRSVLPPARRLGPASVWALAGGYAAAWIIVGPSDGGWLSFAGQLAGAEAVLLMSVAIVLISVLPAVEAWFDGIDKTAIWHRRLSITGLLLLVPHIMFSSGHHGPPTGARGTDQQIWIAGGIGITPFLSWIRALDRFPSATRVDLFYSTEGAAPFADEITAVARTHNVRVHLHDSGARGYLTPDEVLAAAGHDDPRAVSVFLCGPAGMVGAFVRRFREAGIPNRNIHREHFDWR